MTDPRCRLHFLLVSLFLFGCSSATKRIVTLDSAIGDNAELAKLCDDGRPAACALVGREGKPVHTISVMQSVTSAEQARFVAVVPADSRLNYYVVGPQSIKKVLAEVGLHQGSKDQVDRIEAFDLKLGENYELVVIDNDGRLRDRRKFAALDLKKKNARLALVSCMDDHLDDVQKKIWPELLAHKPDAIVMLGDNVYADWAGGQRRDVTEPLQIWQRYAETRKRLELFKANPLVPVVAVWDDHDFGKNDADRTFVFKEQASSIFLTYFDQTKPAPGFERGPGLASWWTAFGVQFALLDDRSFRSPNGVDVPDQTHFGPDQEVFVKEGLAAAKTPVLLASGDQFFGGYHKFESYEGSHPGSFKTQLARWRRVTAQPIVFLSGDRHLTEIIKVGKEHLGYPTYEITSSGIHAKVFAGAFAKAPSPNQLAGRDGEYNYTLVDIVRAEPKILELNVQSLGLDQKVHYQQALTVKR